MESNEHRPRVTRVDFSIRTNTDGISIYAQWKMLESRRERVNTSAVKNFCEYSNVIAVAITAFIRTLALKPRFLTYPL